MLQEKHNDDPDALNDGGEICGGDGCRGQCEDNTSRQEAHIQDLCPADRQRIAQLVEKLAECNQARHKAVTELEEMKAEIDVLINRYEVRCREHELENARLKEQVEIETKRVKMLKQQSSRSLDALGEQLLAQEGEFSKLTETVKELLREKIQLSNALIERETRVKIAEAKLERSKESLEMEKLLFIKNHVKDSLIKTVCNRACQTLEDNVKEAKNCAEERESKKSETKSKDDLEDTSGDGVLLRSLFFKPTSCHEDTDSPVNILYQQSKFLLKKGI